jgi:hypothetical protein
MPPAMAIMPVAAAMVIIMRCRAVAVAMRAAFGRSFTHFSSSRHLHDLAVGTVQAR